MKIAICDDNIRIATAVEEYLLELRFKDLVCDVYGSGVTLLDYLQKNDEQYQIYFLDIQMPGLDGIKTAEKIRENDKKALIIFMTDYKDYVFQVFEVLPFRFLLKPIQKLKLQAVYYDALNYLCASKKFFFFSIENEKFQVPFEEIIYFESDKRKLKLSTVHRNYIFYGKLLFIAKQLDMNFFARIHVSYIINLENMSKLLKNEITMVNGDTLPISKKYQTTVKQQHMDYIKWRNGV